MSEAYEEPGGASTAHAGLERAFNDHHSSEDECSNVGARIGGGQSRTARSGDVPPDVRSESDGGSGDAAPVCEEQGYYLKESMSMKEWASPEDTCQLVKYPTDARELQLTDLGAKEGRLGDSEAWGLSTYGATCINIPYSQLQEHATTLSNINFPATALDASKLDYAGKGMARMLSCMASHALYVQNGTTSETRPDDGVGPQGQGETKGTKIDLRKLNKGLISRLHTPHPDRKKCMMVMRQMGFEHLLEGPANTVADGDEDAKHRLNPDDYSTVGIRVWWLRTEGTFSENKGVLGLINKNYKQPEWYKNTIFDPYYGRNPFAENEKNGKAPEGDYTKEINHIMLQMQLSTIEDWYAASKAYTSENPTALYDEHATGGHTGCSPDEMFVNATGKGEGWLCGPEHVLNGRRSEALKSNLWKTNPGTPSFTGLLCTTLAFVSIDPVNSSGNSPTERALEVVRAR